MDKASLTLESELDSDVMVSWVSEHCYQVHLYLLVQSYRGVLLVWVF